MPPKPPALLPSPQKQKIYFNCVVMGNEYLEPEERVAKPLKKVFHEFNSLPNSTVEVDAQFPVETTFAPKPYLLPISTEELHCAIILFSPMRPLSFVRIDSFIDRVLHSPGVKIILLVLDADVLGSEHAILSLQETSRCRPVARTDVKRYLQLKRRILRKLDDYEEEQLKRNSEGTKSSFFGMNSSFANFSASALQASPKKRELIVSVFQPKLLESSIENYEQAQIISALKWCFSKHFGTENLNKYFPGEKKKTMDLVSTPREEESKKDDDDAEDDEEIIARHEKEKQEDEEGLCFNDVAWPLEWDHQVQESRKFFRTQKLLFGNKNRKLMKSNNINNDWVTIPIDTVQHHHDSQNNNHVAAADDVAEEVAAIRRIGSAAVLVRSSSSLAQISKLAAHQGKGNSPPDKITTTKSNNHNDTNNNVVTRFAFWNPVTNQISLSIPKSIVADFQMKNSSLSLFSKRDKEDDETTDSDEEEEEHATLRKFIEYSRENTSSQQQDLQNNNENYLALPSHLAKKAIIMAEKRRNEAIAEAEKKITDRLQQLQTQLTTAERKSREYHQTIETLKHEKEQAQLTKAAIRERVFQAQKQKMKLRLELQKLEVSDLTTFPDNKYLLGNTKLELAFSERLQQIEHRQSLSKWLDKRSEQMQLELEEYNRSGGKAELSRRFYAKFLENQQTRNSILNKLKEENEEIQAEIDVHRIEQVRPVQARKFALEGRKRQLLMEIQEVARDGMHGMKNLNKFLDKLIWENKREKISDKDNNFSSDDEEDREYILKRQNSLSSFSSSSSDESSNSDEEEEMEEKKPPRRQKRMFQNAISNLRSKLREIQQTFRFNPGHLLKPIGLNRSIHLHQILDNTCKPLLKAEQDNLDEFGWIHTFYKDGISAVKEFQGKKRNSDLTFRISDDDDDDDETREDFLSSQPSFLLIIIDEMVNRQFYQYLEAISRMVEINAACLAHTRNISAKAVELAKAKRQSLFGMR
jgi:hypothetical protein